MWRLIINKIKSNYSEMLSFVFAVLTSTAAAISANELEFLKHIARFNKVYHNIEEFSMRLERFVHNHKIITEHNTSGSKNFKLGANQFTDWTPAEFFAILGYNGRRADGYVKSRV